MHWKIKIESYMSDEPSDDYNDRICASEGDVYISNPQLLNALPSQIK